MVGGAVRASASPSFLVHGLSVTIGHFLGLTLPERPIAFAAAIAFLLFAVWTWREGRDDGEEDAGTVAEPRYVLLAVISSFVLAELGDKTMLATVALASDHNWAGVWIGATAGMVLADGVAIAVGAVLHKRLPERFLHRWPACCSCCSACGCSSTARWAGGGSLSASPARWPRSRSTAGVGGLRFAAATRQSADGGADWNRRRTGRDPPLAIPGLDTNRAFGRAGESVSTQIQQTRRIRSRSPRHPLPADVLASERITGDWRMS